MLGGVRGRGHAGQGACMAGGHVWQGGMHGRGMCVVGVGGHVWQILRDTVNERVVRILLECILVKNKFISNVFLCFPLSVRFV